MDSIFIDLGSETVNQNVGNKKQNSNRKLKQLRS